MKSMGLDASLGAADKAEIEGQLQKVKGSEQFGHGGNQIHLQRQLPFW